MSEMILGPSESMKKVLRVVTKVAASEATVLVRGETGTGKELIARELHRQSRRSDGPFVAVNCAAVPADLMESELFGHERGSFTGAHQLHRGKFEAAEGGTILLDEVTEMGLALQPKLLRCLQEREFYRVGGSRPVHADVRVIATTNADIEERVQQRSFRADLLYRLAVVEIEVPPLRERREDIVSLADGLLAESCNRSGVHRMSFTAPARRALQWHHWPGNVRELQNVIERAALLVDGERIDVGDLPDDIAHGSLRASRMATDAPTMTLAEVEREYILSVLRYMQGHKRKTAAILDVNTTTLYRKLMSYGVEQICGTRGGWDERKLDVTRLRLTKQA